MFLNLDNKTVRINYNSKTFFSTQDFLKHTFEKLNLIFQNLIIMVDFQFTQIQILNGIETYLNFYFLDILRRHFQGLKIMMILFYLIRKAKILMFLLITN